MGKFFWVTVTPLANHATHQLYVPMVIIAWSHNDAIAKSTIGECPLEYTMLVAFMCFLHQAGSSLSTTNWTRSRQSVKCDIDRRKYSAVARGKPRSMFAGLVLSPRRTWMTTRTNSMSFHSSGVWSFSHRRAVSVMFGLKVKSRRSSSSTCSKYLYDNNTLLMVTLRVGRCSNLRS